MNLLISFLNKRLIVIFACLFVISGCALKDSRPSGAGNMSVVVQADKAGPRVAGMSSIRWTASAAGFDEGVVYEFLIQPEGRPETVVQVGSSPYWDWEPHRAGIYRTRVVVRDRHGNSVASKWSPPFTIKPRLLLQTLTKNKPAPQAAGMSTIKWRAIATGGIGALTYQFISSKNGGGETVEQSGESPTWNWLPKQGGSYRIKVVVTDQQDNSIDSGWSPSFEVAAQLRIESLMADKEAPQAAGTNIIKWRAQAMGGVGDLTYEFISAGEQQPEIVEQIGFSSGWEWRPQLPGVYRIKLVVRDQRGNVVESSWYGPYEISPPISLAVFTADKPAPQVAGMSIVQWSAIASGGVGTLEYQFISSRDGGGETVEQTGPASHWNWRPQLEGTYRFKVIVKDLRGNSVDSDWSSTFEVAPQLLVESLTADKVAPQAAGMSIIQWQAKGSGGIGELTYEFIGVREDGAESVEQVGQSSYWEWQPQNQGNYRFKVILTDRLGNKTDSGWTLPYEIAPQLQIKSLIADKATPQAAGMTTVLWSAEASGGVGELVYAFTSLDEKNTYSIEQTGVSSTWGWRPRMQGTYKVRVAVSDRLGNTVESEWSTPFLVEPQLRLETFKSDRPSPQNISPTAIQWSVEASGGVGELTYEFITNQGDENETIEQSGSMPIWDWRPQQGGAYRIKVIVRDSIGNVVDSGWSQNFIIKGQINKSALIALLPIQNLSSSRIPHQQIKQTIKDKLTDRGYRILDDEMLEGFMKKHRMRYTGGVDTEISQALAEETDVQAVFITTVSVFKEAGPPKISLIARLVLSGQRPEIFWIDSIGMTGDDSPGLLDLGRIKDAGKLISKAVISLTDSLDAHFALFAKQLETSQTVGQTGTPIGSKKKYQPRLYYRSEKLSLQKKQSVAIIPFLNLSNHPEGGNIVMLHFVKQLWRLGKFTVMEPGLVRHELLKYRAVMRAGPSLAVADVVTSESSLNADLILTGKVFDYQWEKGVPKVDYSVEILDKQSRKLVLTARSYGSGDDGVYIFDAGRERSAHNLTEEMAKTFLRKLIQ